MTRTSPATRRADMFVEAEQHPREDGATLGDERATLVEYVRCQPLPLELKCSGLTAADLPVAPCSRRRCHFSGWCGTSPTSSAAD